MLYIQSWKHQKARRYIKQQFGNEATKDLTNIKQIKNENGEMLTDERKIKERLKKCFKQLLNEENHPRVVIGDRISKSNDNIGNQQKRIIKVLKKVKINKAKRPIKSQLKRGNVYERKV